MGGYPADLSQAYGRIGLQLKSAQFGFTGSSYQSRSRKADAERLINGYLEANEAGHGVPFSIIGTPGVKLFCTLTDAPLRGLWGFDEGLFAVAGGTLFRIFPDKSFMVMGTLPNSPGPVQFFPNGPDLFLVSAGEGYLLHSFISQVVAASTGAFLDGYFIAAQPASKNLQISSLYNGAIWDPIDFAVKEGYPDPIVSILADHEQLWIFGSQKTEVWYDAGATNFPFVRIPGAYIEQGCYAQFSPAQLDNSIFWLGGDARGAGVVWRAVGYAPLRVSNHAIEEQFRQYILNSTIQDAIGHAYQEGGHSFYELHFPSAGHTWVYDVATQMWHERAQWDLGHAVWRESPARYHAFALGQHFVGGSAFDPVSGLNTLNGNVYAQSLDYFTEAGNLIRRLRSSPHVNTALRRNRYHSLVVDMEVGDISALVDGQGNPRPVQVMLRVSRDGGEKWSQVLTTSAGRTGETGLRAIFRRLGYAKDAAFEVTITDPVQVSIIDAYLSYSPGN